ncbi:MAG TPA: YceH family protein [Thermoleophilaceae bacterium]|nr:YceH family protein [Thermoleophilaceae bacterium]
MEPDAVEIRVVACLVEKQRTTPDQYPLTLNSLRLACNQSTNRDPVVEYDEGTVRSALDRLGRRKWTMLASWSTARSVKYKQVLDQALGLTPAQLSLLAVLMLRGPQTPGELRGRTERMYRFDSNEELESTLRELIERELVAPLARRPGERGQRYTHLLEGEGEVQPVEGAPPPMPERAAPGADGGLGERVDRLEAEVSALRAELHGLRDRLDA